MIGRGLAAAMVWMLLLCGAAWAEGISYLDIDGTKQTCDTYTEVNATTKELGTGWYVVTENVTVKNRIKVTGVAHLILVNGVKLSAKKGIQVPEHQALTIYAQTTDPNQMGALDAVSPESDAHAGIGSNQGKKSGMITIASGCVTAKGSSKAAGIGGGSHGDCGTVLIYGGDVEAWGGDSISGGGAGIGGGDEGKGGDVTISGGKVTAKGGTYGAGIGGGDGGSNDVLTISGGEVEARGGVKAAGIGGGEKGHGGEVTISGGKVTAIGGDEAAGIGGGNEFGNGGMITISGGEVTAKCSGDFGAGIGGGDRGSAEMVIISGGKVTATGGTYGAGIGGGSDWGTGGKVIISGGTVTANGGEKAAGIGGGKEGRGGRVTISGGTITANGGAQAPGIGAGADDYEGVIEISGGKVVANGKSVAFWGTRLHLTPPAGKTLLVYDANNKQLSYPTKDNYISTFKSHKKLTVVASDYGKSDTIGGIPNLPQTGDDSRMALWILLLALSAAGATALKRRYCPGTHR